MRLRPAASAALAAGLLALVPPSRAQDTVARSLAATCANCHGTNGVSRGEVPSLAGLPSRYSTAASSSTARTPS